MFVLSRFSFLLICGIILHVGANSLREGSLNLNYAVYQTDKESKAEGSDNVPQKNGTNSRQNQTVSAAHGPSSVDGKRLEEISAESLHIRPKKFDSIIVVPFDDAAERRVIDDEPATSSHQQAPAVQQYEQKKSAESDFDASLENNAKVLSRSHIAENHPPPKTKELEETHGSGAFSTLLKKPGEEVVKKAASSTEEEEDELNEDVFREGRYMAASTPMIPTASTAVENTTTSTITHELESTNNNNSKWEKERTIKSEKFEKFKSTLEEVLKISSHEQTSLQKSSVEDVNSMDNNEAQRVEETSSKLLSKTDDQQIQTQQQMTTLWSKAEAEKKLPLDSVKFEPDMISLGQQEEHEQADDNGVKNVTNNVSEEDNNGKSSISDNQMTIEQVSTPLPATDASTSNVLEATRIVARENGVFETSTTENAKISDEEWSIWRRIIEGIRCARQDCRGALKEEFLKHLNQESRRLITENSWSTKMRRARLAGDDNSSRESGVDNSSRELPLLICTCDINDDDEGLINNNK